MLIQDDVRLKCLSRQILVLVPSAQAPGSMGVLRNYLWKSGPALWKKQARQARFFND